MNRMGKIRIHLTVKVCTVILLVSLSVTGLISVLNYRKYLNAVYSVHSDYAQKICKTIEGILSDEQWKTLVSYVVGYQNDTTTEEELETLLASPGFKEAIPTLRSYAENLELEEIAVFFVDEEEMLKIDETNFSAEDSLILYVLMDVCKAGMQSEEIDCGLAGGWWDSYDSFQNYCEILTGVMESGEDYPTLETVENGMAYLSDYYPIMEGNQTIAMIMVSGNAITITGFLHSFFMDTLLTGFLVTLALSLIAVLFVYFRMVRPLQILRKEADDFIRNNTESSNQLAKIRTHDEIEDLANSFLEMEHEIQDYVSKVEEITEENARINTELNVAKKIQVDMLPTVFPPFPDRREFQIYATMNPAKEVGGDFYDFFFIDEDHLVLVIADVAGKGVPAALFMAIAKSLIKNRAQMGGTPSQILFDVNNQLCDGNEEGMFVTLWMSIINLNTGECVEVNAGHEHPVRQDANSPYELICYRHSLAMATVDGIPFKQHSFTLQPGSRIFVYTDGLPEAINTDKKAYGTDRFLEILNANAAASPEELLRMIAEDVQRYQGEEPQFDDMTMLMFEYIGRDV